MDQVFADPQVQHRGMHISMPYQGSQSGRVEFIGNPIKFSETPVDYRRPPPKMGEHTDAVLDELLDMDAAEIERLRKRQVI